MLEVPQTKRSLISRGLSSTQDIWLEEKRNRDMQLWGNQQGLWIVQDKIYDLTTYMDSHPGGKQWIQYTKGQDITQNFITHHLHQEKVRLVLQKYFVKQVPKKQKPRYTFEKNGLFRKIKTRLLQKYTPQELQNNQKSVKDGIILLFLWFFLFMISCFCESYFCAILCGLSLYPIAGVAHNFVHMKYHPFRYLWSLTGFSHEQWEKMHCLSHHSYPNTLLDYQIQALEPIVYYLSILPPNKPIFGILKQIAFATVTPFNISLHLIILPVIKRIRPNLLYIIPLLQIPLIFIITKDIYVALSLFLVMHISFGILFMKLAFLGHRTGQEWTEGNPEISDFAEHQIYASSDTKTNDVAGLWSYILYAGFNFHAIHHMFPTIDNHYLPLADKILVQQARKVGIIKNQIPNILKGLMEIESNFYSRKIWKKSKSQ